MQVHISIRYVADSRHCYATHILLYTYSAIPDILLYYQYTATLLIYCCTIMYIYIYTAIPDILLYYYY